MYPHMRHNEGERDYGKMHMEQGKTQGQMYQKQHDSYSCPSMEMMQLNLDSVNIYIMKKYVKVRFTYPDTLFQSYSIFRQQCCPYGIYLSNISQITHKEISICPAQVNGRKFDKEHRDEMSNIIYDYLHDEKTVPLSYQPAKAALKKCEPKLDGYSVLF